MLQVYHKLHYNTSTTSAASDLMLRTHTVLFSGLRRSRATSMEVYNMDSIKGE